MDMRTLRASTGMSQRDFSKRFGIPIGTLRNWEQGISKPPEYVFSMIFAQTRRNIMINLETVVFMKTMDLIAEKTKNGIEPFANATEENLDDKAFYDANTKNDENQYMVVYDACVIDDPNCAHHDVISYFGNSEYNVRATTDEEGKWYILVTFNDDDEQIVIEDGKWYFVD